MADAKDGAAPPVAQAPPMTAGEFIDEFNALIERGKAAGLNPIALMARTGIRQGAGWFDRVLAAIDSNGAPVVKK